MPGNTTAQAAKTKRPSRMDSPSVVPAALRLLLDFSQPALQPPNQELSIVPCKFIESVQASWPELSIAAASSAQAENSLHLAPFCGMGICVGLKKIEAAWSKIAAGRAKSFYSAARWRLPGNQTEEGRACLANRSGFGLRRLAGGW